MCRATRMSCSARAWQRNNNVVGYQAFPKANPRNDWYY